MAKTHLSKRAEHLLKDCELEERRAEISRRSASFRRTLKEATFAPTAVRTRVIGRLSW